MLVEIGEPHGIVWQGEATGVTLPAHNGEMGILPGHTPLMALLRPGHLVISREGRDDVQYEITKGFVTVDEDHIYVVVDSASAGVATPAGTFRRPAGQHPGS